MSSTEITLQGLQEMEPTIIEKVREIESKNLLINGLTDKEGYENVKKARMELVHTRTDIRKVGKAIRDDAVKFQKAVIAREDELVALLSPLEDRLTAEQKRIDDEKAEIENQKKIAAEKLLKDRVNALGAVGYAHDAFALQNMDESAYQTLLSERIALWEAAEAKRIDLERREALMKEKEAEQRAIADAQRHQQEKIDAENARVAREAEMKKAREEAAEKSRIDTELRLKREAEEKAQCEAAEQAKLERSRKYKAFLAKYDCSDENADQWRAFNTDAGEVKLYRLVGTLTL